MKGVWRRRSDRKRWLLETVIGLAMLPLTALPIYLYLERTPDGYLMFLRGVYSLHAPATPAIDGKTELAAFTLREEKSVGVPVLVYHGVGRTAIIENVDKKDSRMIVGRDHFAQQMRALQAAGYHAIDSAKLADYLRSGDASLLPPKPVLISFDDGRTDAMLQADPILKATGMKATMFVIGAAAESNSFYYVSWSKLRGYADNGRWDLQAHTFELHHIHDDVKGRLPLSAVVDPDRGESVASWRTTLDDDFSHEDRALRKLGSTPIAFAYPFSDWGQRAKPGVAKALRNVLARHYQLAFDQAGQSGLRFTLPGDDPLHIHRLEVLDWTGPQFVHRLEQAEKLTRVTYEERGLGYDYSPRALAEATVRQVRQPVAMTAIRSVDTGGRKLVALTFDDGPSPFTAQVLDVLRAHGAHATFFVIGSQLAGHGDLLQRMLVEGNEVGNQTWGGGRTRGLSAAKLDGELARTSVAIQHALPLAPQIARAPFGEDLTRFAHAAAEHGMTSIRWSVDPEDYKDGAPAAIAARVLADARPGAIVVLHDGGDAQRWRTVQALPRILAGLEVRGYRLVTVSQLRAAAVHERPHPRAVPAHRRAAPARRLHPPSRKHRTRS